MLHSPVQTINCTHQKPTSSSFSAKHCSKLYQFYCYFGGPKCLPHSGHYFVHIWCLVNCSSLLGRQHIQLWNNSLLSESPLAQDVFYQKVKNYFKNITSSAYQTHTVAFFHQICMCSAKKNLSTINTNERTSCYKGKT